MNLKTKLKYETQEDLLGSWLETDQEFRQTRRQAYRQYLRNLATKYPRFNNLSNNLYMTYTQIVNLITKNAIAATIIMILALGGTATAAAQFFAPEEYKPSNWFRKDLIYETIYYKPATSFAECEEFGGVVMESYPRQCQWQGELFVEDISEGEVTTNNYEGWQTFRSETYGFEIRHPNNFDRHSGGGDGRYYENIISLRKEGTGAENSGNVGEGIMIGVQPNASDNLIEFAEKEFEDSKAFCESEPSAACQGQMDYEIIDVNNGKLLIIKNPNPSPDQTPYRQVFAKPNSGKDIFKLHIANNFAELEEMLKSVSFFRAGEDQDDQDKATTKTYKNDKQNFSVSYPSDWTVETKKDSEAPELLSELKLGKDGMTLLYKFKNGISFGVEGVRCTNNENLFLEVGDGYTRIRKNDGSRIYSTGKTSYKYDKADLVDLLGINESDLNQTNSKWLGIMGGGEGGSAFAYCYNNAVRMTKTSVTHPDFNAPNNIISSVLFPIEVQGSNAQDRDLLKEADKIVASTRLR